METKICHRCIMSDAEDCNIKIDSNGFCNFCTDALKEMQQNYFPNAEGEKKLQQMLHEIKEKSKNKKYDCIMGVSGGLDSAYLLYLGTKIWNLRVLAVHVDDGFDTPLAKANIKNLCEACGVQLHTINLDLNEFNDVIKAYFLAGVSSLCAVQDNALFTAVYRYAEENHINVFLSGGNYASEAISYPGKMHNYFDVVNMNDIYYHYSHKKINNLELMTPFQKYIGNKYLKKIYTYKPLNYLNYNLESAIQQLESVGFHYYQGKHYESILTRFHIGYYMPRKFGVDFRKAFLSNLILSGQISREAALNRLSDETYPQLEDDILFFIDKIGITRPEFESKMLEEPQDHFKYKTSKWFKIKKAVTKLIGGGGIIDR